MAVTERLANDDSRGFFFRTTGIVAGILVLIYLFQGLLLAARDIVRRKWRVHHRTATAKNES